MINKIIAYIVLGLMMWGCESRQISINNIAEPGSKFFNKKVTSFSLSPGEAFKLVENSDNNFSLLLKWKPILQSSSTFHDTPTMIFGDYYIFSRYSKTELPFTGYYVNGYTGEVQFRTSNYVDSFFNPQPIPENFFTSIEVLKEGNSPKE